MTPRQIKSVISISELARQAGWSRQWLHQQIGKNVDQDALVPIKVAVHAEAATGGDLRVNPAVYLEALSDAFWLEYSEQKKVAGLG